jgi:hypothetical protein
MKTENHLAKELGINRNILIKMRKGGRITSSSWKKVSNQIVYHAEGEDEVREILKKELSADQLSDPLPPPDEPREMVITKIPFNTRMVLCGDIKVKVSNNQKFRAGMKVNARPSIDSKHVWVMTGRCPRYNGRY